MKILRPGRHTRANAVITSLVIAGAIVFGPSPAAALCASTTGSFEDSEVVLIGVVTGGVTSDGSLASPASFDVVRYQKGSGPNTVRVQTGIEVDEDRGLLQVNPDGIRPRVGERWQLFGQIRHGILRTNICLGSHRLRARLADTGVNVSVPTATLLALIGAVFVLGSARVARRAPR